MVELADLPLPEHPRLAQNIAHFARALRKAGLPIGPGRVMDAVRAVEAAGFTSRGDFYWTLQACFVSRPEHRVVFGQVFRLFWRDPRYLEHMMALLLPMVRGTQPERAPDAAERRASEALTDAQAPEVQDTDDGSELVLDAARTSSASERLRHMDFEQMSPDEMAAARRLLAQMRLPVPPLLSRRQGPSHRGTIDARATLRAMARTGGEVAALRHRAPRPRPQTLVVLCDISGSMSAYARAVLHLVHGTANSQGDWARVHAFTFGTRLTNITRHMAARDVDVALAAAGAQAQDWDGGTRIGESLDRFNRDWSRRVLGQGAVVVLVTDGLERGDPAFLARAAERLHLSCRHLIWLNPLLRFDEFAPRAAGIRALLRHVDAVRAGHDIAALEGVVRALTRPEDGGDWRRLMAMG